jgi:hypothetical protein
VDKEVRFKCNHGLCQDCAFKHLSNFTVRVPCHMCRAIINT